MTTITCDLCNDEVARPIKVEVRDGEHPHAGATMYKDIDCCEDCVRQIPKLQSPAEYDDLRNGRRS